MPLQIQHSSLLVACLQGYLQRLCCALSLPDVSHRLAVSSWPAPSLARLRLEVSWREPQQNIEPTRLLPEPRGAVAILLRMRARPKPAQGFVASLVLEAQVLRGLRARTLAAPLCRLPFALAFLPAVCPTLPTFVHLFRQSC